MVLFMQLAPIRESAAAFLMNSYESGADMQPSASRSYPVQNFRR